MKKILFIVPSLSKGGAERVVATLSRSLSSEYDVDIAVFSSKRIDYEYEGELIDLEIPEDSNRLIKNYKALKKIKKIKKNIKPDVSISFLPEPNLINVLSRTEKEKTITSVRNMLSKTVKQPGFPYSFLSRVLIRLFYNKADLVVPVSKGVGKDLNNSFNIKEEKMEIIYNPCNIEEVRELSNEDLPEYEKEIFQNPCFITVGSLTKQKAQWRMIRAFKELKNRVNEANLVIIGKGELENDLKDLSKKLELEDSVHFLGFKDNPFKYVSKGDAFLLSSLWEGLPNVILESLSVDTLVISTDCQAGPREILSPNLGVNEEVDYPYYSEYGVLTKVFDDEVFFEDLRERKLSEEEKMFAETMIKFIEDEKLKEDYSNGLERAKNFKISNIINQWEEVLE